MSEESTLCDWHRQSIHDCEFLSPVIPDGRPNRRMGPDESIELDAALYIYCANEEMWREIDSIMYLGYCQLRLFNPKLLGR